MGDSFQKYEECVPIGSGTRYQIIQEQRFLDSLDEEEFQAKKDLEEDMLVRDLKAAALRRQEEGARSEDDFKKIIEKWDKNDENRKRKERYNEILRGDVPIDYGCSYSPDLKIFPKYMNTTAERQLSNGNFLDYIYDCPYEMHDLTSIGYARNIVKSLKNEHREILYFCGVKNFKIKKVAEMRGQSERNIRRARCVVYKKVWRKVYAELSQRKKKGCILSERESNFMRGYEEGTLVMDDGE